MLMILVYYMPGGNLCAQQPLPDHKIHSINVEKADLDQYLERAAPKCCLKNTTHSLKKYMIYSKCCFETGQS